MRSLTVQSPASSRLLHVTPRLAVVTLIGTLAASCSSDVMRFSDNPFSDPFHSQTAEATPPVPSVPTSHVQSRPLAAPAGRQATGGSFGQPDRSIVTGSVRPSQPAPEPVRSSGYGSWSPTGGSSLTVGQGDTVAVISSRYGVPEAAIRSANNLGPHANPAPGSRVIIPVYRYGAAGAPSPRANEKSVRPVAAKAEAPRVEAKRHDEAKKEAEAKKHEAADAKKKAAEAKAAEAKTAEAKTAEAKAAANKPAEPQKLASKKPVEAPKLKTAAVAPQVKAAEEEPDALPTGTVKPSAPDFRWPARGRIIARFGNGNDGINVALPEGTSVRATEDGTVAYAGDEIKGYGKLVLVRHASGWVSAYANNEDLLVKKGEAVKRGQVVAKSGQTGNVTTPQLHFELRKGKSPVDPQQYLGG